MSLLTSLLAPGSGTSLPAWRSTALYGAVRGNAANVSLVADRALFVPVWAGQPETVNAIKTYVITAGTAGTLIRMGIYEASVDGLPSSLLLDAGTVDGASAGEKTIAISATMPAGLSFLAVVAQSTGATLPDLLGSDLAVTPWTAPAGADDFITGKNQVLPRNEGVSGALPASATITDSDALPYPLLAVRKS